MYFEDGNKNSSVKMNAAMMRDQLKQQFPNSFPISGKTETRKFISKLVSQNKKNTKQIQMMMLSWTEMYLKH